MFVMCLVACFFQAVASSINCFLLRVSSSSATSGKIQSVVMEKTKNIQSLAETQKQSSMCLLHVFPAKCELYFFGNRKCYVEFLIPTLFRRTEAVFSLFVSTLISVFFNGAYTAG